MIRNNKMLNDQEYKNFKSMLTSPEGVRFGTVAVGYVGGTTPVPVLFDGESGTPDSYKRCATYSPTAGDRVMLVRKGGTWVIVDKLV